MITQPIEYTEGEAAIVNAFDQLPTEVKTGDYWGDEAVKPLRGRIKTHYITVQNNRCCYCNIHIPSENHNNWNAEHVVSRAKHPRFLFTPKNLSVSCLDCNIAKSEQEVLNNPNLVNYPNASSAFKILHPHFDNFEDHIWVSGFVYLGKTLKGKKTIYMCDMLRYSTKYIDWDNSAADKRFESDVDKVFSASSDAKAALDAIAQSLP